MLSSAEPSQTKHVTTTAASYDVKENDIIEITMGSNVTKIQVTKVSEHATKDDAALMYKVID